MLIEDMVDLGDDQGDDKTGLCNPGLGDEGRVGKDGESDTLLSSKPRPSIWIVVGESDCPHFILRKEHPEIFQRIDQFI